MINKALTEVFSAKTLTMWLILSLIAFVGFVIILVVALVAGQTFEGLYQSLLAFLGVSGSGGTVRNIASDGIMPRLAMIEGAKHDPQVALQSPAPMVKLQPESVPASSTSAVTDAAEQPPEQPPQPPRVPLSGWIPPSMRK